MFKTLQTLTAMVATLTLTGCANTYNPLEDYERATAPFIHFGIYRSRQ
jgi:hypothetical protein